MSGKGKGASARACDMIRRVTGRRGPLTPHQEDYVRIARGRPGFFDGTSDGELEADIRRWLDYQRRLRRGR